MDLERDKKNRELIIRARGGEEGALVELIKINEPAIHYIVRSFTDIRGEYDDLVSLGIIGMIKAYRTFDLNMKIAFITYSSTCVRNELRYYFRESTRHSPYAISLNTEINKDADGRVITYNDIISDDRLGNDLSEIYAENEEKQILRKNIDKLPEEERIIMTERWFNNKTQAEVANILGISQSIVSRKEKKILKKIANRMNPHQ